MWTTCHIDPILQDLEPPLKEIHSTSKDGSTDRRSTRKAKLLWMTSHWHAVDNPKALIIVGSATVLKYAG